MAEKQKGQSLLALYPYPDTTRSSMWKYFRFKEKFPPENVQSNNCLSKVRLSQKLVFLCKGLRLCQLKGFMNCFSWPGNTRLKLTDLKAELKAITFFVWTLMLRSLDAAPKHLLYLETGFYCGPDWICEQSTTVILFGIKNDTVCKGFQVTIPSSLSSPLVQHVQLKVTLTQKWSIRLFARKILLTLCSFKSPGWFLRCCIVPWLSNRTPDWY